MTGARLESFGLTRRYGGLTAVDSVDVTVEPGRVSALIGPNGAGKTTLFACLTGVERPDAGQVLLDGHDITSASSDARARMGIGRTFQRLAVFPTMTVADNLGVAAENRGNPSSLRRVLGLMAGAAGWTPDESAAAERVEEVLAQLGLGAVRDRPAGVLPTGTLRLVELGRALCRDPDVLLLDEPASGLDSEETLELQAVLRSVAASGVAVLLVEHDVDLVFDIADTVYAMAEGRLIASGPPADVRAHPAVRAAYLDPAAETAS
jgi:branched-chain amino acid transport system ATP-binding protein